MGVFEKIGDRVPAKKNRPNQTCWVSHILSEWDMWEISLGCVLTLSYAHPMISPICIYIYIYSESTPIDLGEPCPAVNPAAFVLADGSISSTLPPLEGVQ